MPCTLSRTALVTGLALLAPFAMHAQDSQQLLESYAPSLTQKLKIPTPASG